MTPRNHAPVSPGRRRILKYGAVLGGTMAMSSFLTFEVPAAGMATVRMQLGWLAGNNIMGEVVAGRMGYYEEEGIQLEVIPGGPEVNGMATVTAGQAQAGLLSSSPSLMLARSAGIPIKAFAAGYQKHPFTFFSLERDPIRTPRDMIGKTIATQPTAVILLRALLAKNGIAEDQVEVIKMGRDLKPLLTGRATAVTGWLTDAGALKTLGSDRIDMLLWDAGIQLYANVYYTTDDMLSKHTDVLTRFLAGSARGWREVRRNPEASVRHLVAEYGYLDRETERDAVGRVLGFSFNDVTTKDGWGAMNRVNWQSQIDLYAQLGQFKGDAPSVDDVMTTDLLEATKSMRKDVG